MAEVQLRCHLFGQVADLPTGTAVRDTQNREAGHLLFPCQEWSALLTGVGAGS
ncbi:DUF397 domain-containing protein [Nocardiopsis sp. B62]|nr:DUF397 domain-containing protein [Nocardiopsis sp. B62]MBQ1081064.1 DUF397 domain-containing protein [Nocardiopsis sp. B62]